jgi:hypothetical protein
MPLVLPRSVPTAAAPAVVVLALALTGCGGGAEEVATLRTDELEATIVRQFAAQGVPLTDVSCKDGVEARVGAPIACTARNPSRTTLVLEGTVTGLKGVERGSVRVKAVRGVAQGPVVAAQALRVLEGKVGRRARGLTCPAEVPIPTAPTVTCELTTSTGERYDTAVALDAQSRLRVRVADRPKS